MTSQPDSDNDPFDFVPAPSTSSRVDGWTAQRQRAFIAILAEHGGVAAAARAVGMTPQTANRLRRRTGAESFARAWDAAQSEGYRRMYDQALTEARSGRLVPITYAGRVIRYRRVFDNRLLIACYGMALDRVKRTGAAAASDGAKVPRSIDRSELSPAFSPFESPS